MKAYVSGPGEVGTMTVFGLRNSNAYCVIVYYIIRNSTSIISVLFYSSQSPRNQRSTVRPVFYASDLYRKQRRYFGFEQKKVPC